jgi:hypothetical protein
MARPAMPGRGSSSGALRTGSLPSGHPSSGTSHSIGRVVRFAVTGFVAGAAAGFVAALLRPRPWVEYETARLVSTS